MPLFSIIEGFARKKAPIEPKTLTGLCQYNSYSCCLIKLSLCINKTRSNYVDPLFHYSDTQCFAATALRSNQYVVDTRRYLV